MNTARPLPPLEYLQSRLDYCAETGVLMWKAKPVKSRMDKSWNTRFAGRSTGNKPSACGYRMINLFNSPLLAHRVAYSLGVGALVPPNLDIDHINRDRADNRLRNLRLATRSENTRHGSGPSSDTIPRGVQWNKQRNRWVVRMLRDGRIRQLGSFNDMLIAGAFAADARNRLHGEFAYHGIWTPDYIDSLINAEHNQQQV